MAAWFWRLVEWLWPARCVSCGRLGEWWCAVCDAKVVVIRSPACPRCNRLTRRGEYCRTCRPHVALTGILAGAHLRDPLPSAIKALKYRHAKAIVPDLARYLILALCRADNLRQATLVPIPLHRSRERRRGHNQADLLAAAVSRATGLPVSRSLKRIRATASQTGLDRTRRQRNVAGAFAWRGPLTKPILLLVDDVTTTGATLDAAAEAGRAAGARQVWGLVVARR